MGYVMHVDVQEWRVSLNAQGRTASDMFVVGQGLLMMDRTTPLFVAGGREPLTCPAMVQLMRSEGEGLVGKVQYLDNPLSIVMGVYHLALFDEVVHRHRMGGVLPQEVMAEVDVAPHGIVMVWDKAPLVARWVNINMRARMPAAG